MICPLCKSDNLLSPVFATVINTKLNTTRKIEMVDYVKCLDCGYLWEECEPYIPPRNRRVKMGHGLYTRYISAEEAWDLHGIKIVKPR